ncbi:MULTISPECIES: hypothetical protein [Symbiopectobacterium]|uniref:hypothetical protein n=1 Tax=Symbiopectobacterium TaxID=801 RepID=UPI001A212E98|nr:MULTISPECIES: hypothetical protein [Symbiopectobacterium]MBG6248361.1 hypothetical protein [Candidatus Symbiopectobacterium sp. PLON1]MBT9430272.1 hypothetical protein [Candidatus Symbiopectobacterium endolongispinus]
MIAELSAAMAAIRETAQLAKLINDAKTEAEVNAAVNELNSKLSSIQCECVSLVELVGTYQEMNTSLKAKIAEFENFKVQAVDYSLNKVDSGTLVYSKNIVLSDGETAVNACPHCFHQNKISILQPDSVTGFGGFYVHFCPECKNKFRMNRVPPSKSRNISHHVV